MDDITKARVRNGYGITTSRYSISELGYDDKTSDAVASRPKPPSNVHVYSKLHYPSLRSPHLQVCYPETVAKLQPPFGQLTRKETPSELKRFSGPVRTRGMRADWTTTPTIDGVAAGGAFAAFYRAVAAGAPTPPLLWQDGALPCAGCACPGGMVGP